MLNEQKREVVIMKKEVSIKTLIVIILIGGLILGVISVWLARSLSNSMAKLYNPIENEHSYLNTL